MKRIGVIANCGKPHAASVLRRLGAKARQSELELVVACRETAALLPDIKPVTEKVLTDRIEVLLALGGDGTMLRAARALLGKDIPVLGVNLGSLGFMTSVPEEHLERAIDSLKKGEFTTSTRSVIDCTVYRNNGRESEHRALNEVAIGWGTSSRVVTLELSISGEDVTSYSCDGLIVSTPTGSTGHSLSAGGPILLPETRALIVNLICPHTLSNRPLVVPDDSVITVNITGAEKKLLLSVDGQEEQSLVSKDRLEIRRSPHSVRFVHLPDYSYFSVLRQKLHWRGSSV
jgi:NAD+ kinase